MLRRAGFVVGSLLLLCSLSTVPVRAQAAPAESTVPAAQPADADAEARRQFEAGRHAFDGARYGDAYRAFHASYMLSARAPLLLNMSRALEADGRPDEAAAALVEWLRVSPEDAPERPVVEARRARLAAQAAQEREAHAAREAAVPSPAPPAPAPVVAQAVVPTHPLPAPRARPALLRYGLWTGAALLAAGGATLAALGRGDIRDVESPGANAHWQSRADDYARGPRLVGAGIGVLSAGVACAVAAAFYEWWPRSSASEQARRTARPALVVMPGGLSGRF